MESSDTETNCRQWFFVFGLCFVLFCCCCLFFLFFFFEGMFFFSLNHTTTRKCAGGKQELGKRWRCGRFLYLSYIYLFSILYKCEHRNYDRPQLVEAFKGKFVQEISCGSSHSAAVLSSGELFTWGLGEYGRLGHGDNQIQVRPKQASIIHGVLLLHYQLKRLSCSTVRYIVGKYHRCISSTSSFCVCH